jgi:hypothetical protein
MELAKFFYYVMSFYGAGGIYDMGATSSMVQEATQTYIEDGGDFCGDSIDRELVRDIMIRDYGLTMPDVTVRKVAQTP